MTSLTCKEFGAWDRTNVAALTSNIDDWERSGFSDCVRRDNLRTKTSLDASYT